MSICSNWILPGEHESMVRRNLVFNANLTYVKIQLNSFGPQIGVYDENKLPSSFHTNTHSDFTQIHKSIELLLDCDLPVALIIFGSIWRNFE